MKKINLNLRVLVGKCMNCKSKVEKYYLSDFSYGLRLLLTESGKYYAYINLIEDPVYKKVASIMEELIENAGEKTTKRQYSDYLDKIFGIACDSINGETVNADRIKRSCPDCGSDDIEYKSEKDGYIKEVLLNIITHENWDKFSDKEKYRLIEEELVKLGYIKY